MGNSTKKRSKLGSKRRLSDGRWEVRVSHGYRVDGKQRTIREVVDTEDAADRRIVEIAADMGIHPEIGAGLTLNTLWSLYKRDKGARLARKTINDYARYMDGLWCEKLGSVDITSITRQEIQHILIECPSRSVAHHARKTLSAVLTYAMNEGYLSAHPMHGHAFELPGDTGSDWDDESVWDDDPFATIEKTRDVWGVKEVVECYERIRGLPLEPIWLAMVGGGLRMEEAFALRHMDVRRIEIAGRMVTQVAIHHAKTDLDERKRTKTRKSVRIATIMEPFGTRYWELAQEVGEKELVCAADPANQNKRWRSYFAEPKRHKRMSESRMVSGKLQGLPYVPLSRMRATHATLMQEAGVLDSINAAAHGHSMRVARDHYLRGTTVDAAAKTSRYLELVS